MNKSIEKKFYHDVAGALNELSEKIHDSNVTAGWWAKPEEYGELRALIVANEATHLLPALIKAFERNEGEILALIHSEISEALEGLRKGLVDDHLPNRAMVEVELADTLIRIFDYAGYLGLDLGGALIEKLDYNQTRADHKPENRAKPGGKAF